MKFGLVLISWVYSESRAEIVKRVLDSIAKTDVIGLSAVMSLTFRESEFMPNSEYQRFASGIGLPVMVWQDSEFGVVGQPMISSYSASKLLEADEEITHLVFMYDDLIVNAGWLQKLAGLVERHPGARAWSVYRSRFTQCHRIIGGDDVDVLMTMHDGIGCVSREEWKEYRPTVKPCVGRSETTLVEGGHSFDVHHATTRPGERWATSRDYWNNLAPHEFCSAVDCAIDFVGE
jgi:hypothetical protein